MVISSKNNVLLGLADLLKRNKSEILRKNALDMDSFADMDESMKDLRHRTMARKYVGVRYARPADLDLPGLTPVKRTDRAASFEVDTRRHALADVVKALASRGELEDITIEDEPLENVIAGIYATGTEAEALAYGARRKGGAAGLVAQVPLPEAAYGGVDA